jgi:uncharacterized membrane protein YhaH (DUF805 family)
VVDWVLMPLRRFGDFEGRSSRKEFWLFMPFQLLITMPTVIFLVKVALWNERNEAGNLSNVFWFFMTLAVVAWFGLYFVPVTALVIRRFHDLGHSGWMYLLGLVPYLGGIIIVAFMCFPGVKGPNQYGYDPLPSKYSVDPVD